MQAHNHTWKKLRPISLGLFLPIPQLKWDTWTTKHINFLFPFNPYFAPSISSLTLSKPYSQTPNRPLQFQSRVCLYASLQQSRNLRLKKIPKPRRQYVNPEIEFSISISTENQFSKIRREKAK